MKDRTKYCKVCKKDFDVMYRIQYQNPKKWVLFVKIVWLM